MGKTIRRWPIIVGIIGLLFVASACFQQVGDETQGQVDSIARSATPTPSPTLEPTEEPSPEDFEAEDVSISNSTAATDESLPLNTPISVAQGDDQFGQPTQDPFELTSAALIEEATLRAVIPLTETAAALGIGIVTATPTPTETSLFSAPSGATGVDCVHEVRAGDTMWNLYRRYGVTVNEIATRNGISNFNLIIIGQRLTIPGCGTTGYFPPATSTPIPSLTPFGFGSGGAPLGGDASVAGQGGGIQQPVSCQTQYTIQQFDTLFTLSVRFGVPVQSIVNANPGVIIDANRINMGDTICIPSG